MSTSSRQHSLSSGRWAVTASPKRVSQLGNRVGRALAGVGSRGSGCLACWCCSAESFPMAGLQYQDSGCAMLKQPAIAIVRID